MLAWKGRRTRLASRHLVKRFHCDRGHSARSFFHLLCSGLDAQRIHVGAIKIAGGRNRRPVLQAHRFPRFTEQPREAKLTTGLIINHGSPNWWLSPDIWLAKPPSTSSSPPVANPLAATAYDVWVRVTNPTNEQLSTSFLPWGLQVVWAYPSAGSIPLSFLPPNDTLNSTDLNTIPGGASVTIKCM